MRNTNQYSYSDTRHLQAIARAEARAARQPAIDARRSQARVVALAFIACMGLAVTTLLATSLSTAIGQFVVNVSRMLATGL